MTASPRRWLVLALAPLVAVTMSVFAPASPASAEPGDENSTTKSGSAAPDEGKQDALLEDVLESTGRRYLAAKNAIQKSSKTQLDLAVQVKQAESRRDLLLPQVGKIAGQQYRNGGLSTASFLLDSPGAGGFLDRAISLEELNALNDNKLRELNDAIDEVSRTKARLDQEVKQQKNNVLLMQKQKEAADKALALVGGPLTGGFVDATSKVAAPAPRDKNGDFGPQSCNVDDPTTGGCITARTLHMYQEVKKAGFNRFVGCHRDGGPFEHPKGRACDWSLEKSGFRKHHNNDTLKYGNDLMAFLVRNADRLGILYVIWNKQIWFPTRGWSNYHGPSTHEDHVHVSML
ncbi:coiled-coil domain-containing protein [Actinoplanes sp. NPDC049265]|uniref:coiled-coil domain-containing protein n=1 Tax=Actinoplanes sp. NPDC049265 TaxID=3363902 RepID=UPI0037114D5D